MAYQVARAIDLFYCQDHALVDKSVSRTRLSVEQPQLYQTLCFICLHRLYAEEKKCRCVDMISKKNPNPLTPVVESNLKRRPNESRI